MDFYILALTIFAFYWLLIIILKSQGVLERHNITSYGPILMVRTTRGQKFLDHLARPKRFWNTYADMAVPLVAISMLAMFAILLVGDYRILQLRPEPMSLNEPRNILLLPGINQFIPLTWGLIALVVTLVVHELSHAILSRVADIKVKSLGLLIMVLPIGAFAEPDEGQLFGTDVEEGVKVATRQERIRVLSAGIMSNLVVGIIALALFFGPVLAAIAAAPGLGIVAVVADSPAAKAGIEPGSVILQMDDKTISNNDDFQAFMNTTHAGQVVAVTTIKNGRVANFDVTLDKNPDYDKGFLGVESGAEGILNFLRSIPSKLGSAEGWAYLLGLPFLFFNGFNGDIISLFHPVGWAAPLGVGIFWMANTLLWIGWINFYVGLFNCLPAVPLDGGHIFRELFKSLTERLFKSDITQERVTNALVTVLGMVILVSFVIFLVGPYVFRGI